jgi:hypothetical protein
MEIYKNSIQEYKNKNGVLPLMPASNLLVGIHHGYTAGAVLNNLSGIGQPIAYNGSELFKFGYATRKLYNDSESALKLSLLPGVDNNLSVFNGMVSPNLQLLNSNVEDLLQNTLEILRYTMEIQFNKSWMDPNNGAPASHNSNHIINGAVVRPPAYAYDLGVILNTAESNDLKENKKLITNGYSINAGVDTDSRQKARIYNIIDLNVVPINIHALSRDVPLINLINYSYTLDEIVDQFVRKTWRNRPGYQMNKDDPIAKYPEDIICKLIKDPYVKINASEYYSLVIRAIVGDTGMNSGRVKFLGDQMLNKSLLNTLYSRNQSNENQNNYNLNDEYGFDNGGNLEYDVEARQENIRNNVGTRPERGGPKNESMYKRNIMNTAAARMRNNPNRYMLNAREYLYTNDENISFPVPDDGKDSPWKVHIKIAVISNATRDVLRNANVTRIILTRLGRIRFDTKLSRNMFFTTWLQYITRLMITDRVKGITNAVIDATDGIDSRFDQYADNEHSTNPDLFS